MMGGYGSGTRNKLGDVVRITAWVSRDTKERIDRIAEMTHKHKSEVIRVTLDNYVNESAMILMEE